jgi:hypothetical protein
MYTLEQLQQKNIKELKEIGLQLNVLPEGDKRCRQNWIDALVGVNPPLLQLLELSPAASVVEQVQPIIETVETPSAVEVEPVQTLPIESKFGRILYLRPTQNSIAQAAKTPPSVEVDRVQEAIAPAAQNSSGVDVDSVQEAIAPAVQTFPGVKLDSVQEPLVPAVKTKKRTQKLIEVQAQEPPIVKVVNILKLKTPEELSGIAWEFFNQSPEWLKEALYCRMDDCCEEVGFVEMIIRSFCRNALCGCNFNNIFEKSQALLAVDRNKKRQPSNRKSYPTHKLVRIPKDALGYSGWLCTLTFPQLKKLAAERNVFLDSDSPQDWIEGILSSIDSTSPLVDSEGFTLGFFPPSVDEYLKSFTFGDCPPNRGDNGRDRLETEAKVSQSAIAQAAKNSPSVEVDPVEESIVPAKNFPGSRSKASIAHQLLELFQSSNTPDSFSRGMRSQ